MAALPAVVFAGAVARLRVEPCENVGFDVTHRASDLPKDRPTALDAPDFEGVGLQPEEFGSFCIVEQLHDGVPTDSPRPQMTMGSR